MSFLSITRRRVAAAVAAVALASGAGAFALASGAFASTPTAPTTAAVSHHAKAHRRSLLARSDYATVELKRHGHWLTYTLDRGKVTAVTSTHLTMVRPDGASVGLTLASSTKYKGVSGESSIRVGKRASVISLDGTAVRVTQRS